MMPKGSACVVCKTPGAKLCGRTDCWEKWVEYRKPRAVHSKLERDAAHERFAQSDKVRTDEDLNTRGKPT